MFKRPSLAKVSDTTETVPTTAATVEPSPAQVHVPYPRVTPLSPERYALQVTLSKATREKLQYARDLMGHELPSGDIATVLDRALDALIARLEKRKFAATDRPGRSRRPAEGSRHVPDEIKRAVWDRDGGQCTFVNDAGERCPARRTVEFDHVEPVARGGTATVSTVRLRCRTHNQLAAERVFGAAFMRAKREARSRSSAGIAASAGPRSAGVGLRSAGAGGDGITGRPAALDRPCVSPYKSPVPVASLGDPPRT
jgi:hypothetical protein